jgi:hypothetical protein
MNPVRNATIPNERDLYKMAYETILEISKPTTIRDFNAYKREFEQRYLEANRTARQRSGRFWFNWIFGSMISFKHGDDVAKTIHDYMNHLNGQDRGKNMNLPITNWSITARLLTPSEEFKILKQERGTPCTMRRWLRSSSNAWMMESLLAGREPA